MFTRIIFIIVISLFLTVQNITAQCTATITHTGHGCIGDTINVTLKGDSILQWQHGGHTFSSLYNYRSHYWGHTVAGHSNTLAGIDSSSLYSPIGIFVDHKGNIYIADAVNNRIQKWARGTNYGVTIGPPGLLNDTAMGYDSLHLNHPTGVFVDSIDNVYVSDYGNSRVQKYVPGAKFWITVAGLTNDTIWNDSTHVVSPYGLWVDKGGNIYVADEFNNRVQKWARGAKYGVTVAGQKNGVPGASLVNLNTPRGIWVDTTGNLFIADYANNRVQKWAPGAKYGKTVAGSQYGVSGVDSTQLNGPQGVCMDNIGNLYVADNVNNRVQKWAAGATYGITVAGQPNGTYGWDSAYLLYPSAVNVDSAGYLYVVDNGNNRIQKWSQSYSNLTGTYYIIANASGVYSTLVTDSNKCTATSNTITIYAPSYNPIVNAAICAGNSYTFNGSSYYTTGTYTVKHINIAGCDSSESLNLTVNPKKIIRIDACVVKGTSYYFNGALLTASGIYIDTTISKITGCDSITTLYLTAFAQSLSFTQTGSGCVGDSLKMVTSNISRIDIRNGNRIVHTIYNFTPPSYGVTVAGNINDNNTADSIVLAYPSAVFVDVFKNIYVADEINNRIQGWRPNAKFGITVAGNTNGYAGSDSTLFHTVRGVFVDKMRNVYIADANNNRVQKWKRGAIYGTTVAGQKDGTSGTDSAHLNKPWGIFVDDSNNLFIADGYNARVQKWVPGAKYGITVAGTSGVAGRDSNQFDNPSGIYVDNKQNIFVTDCYNNRVQKWARGAKYGITVAGDKGGYSGIDSAHFSGPTSVYVDKNENIFVSDLYNNRVQMWPKNLPYGITVAGQSNGAFGIDSVHLRNPTAVWLDTSGSIYVADGGNNRVQKFNSIKYNMSNIYTYPTDSAGTYTAVVKYTSGCTVTSKSIIIYNCVNNISNIPAINTHVSVYPNPNSGQFIIEINSNNINDMATIQLLNILGQTVDERNLPNKHGIINTVLGNNQLPDGIYLLKATLGMEVYTARVLVHK